MNVDWKSVECGGRLGRWQNGSLLTLKWVEKAGRKVQLKGTDEGARESGWPFCCLVHSGRDQATGQACKQAGLGDLVRGRLQGWQAQWRSELRRHNPNPDTPGAPFRLIQADKSLRAGAYLKYTMYETQVTVSLRTVDALLLSHPFQQRWTIDRYGNLKPRGSVSLRHFDS